jgi:hypothetical protein
MLSIARRNVQPNLLVENFPDRFRDLPLCERLHDKGFDACLLGGIGIDLMPISGAHDDGHVALDHDERLCQFIRICDAPDLTEPSFNCKNEDM